MDFFLPSLNDPIISILLLLGIIFIIATLSYTYSIYKQNKNKDELINFVKNFDSDIEYEVSKLKYDSSLKKPLSLLANAYLTSGEYNKAIKIYLYLIKNSQDNFFLLNLAKVYLNAGFLKRAETIYLEILSKYPREKEALYYLELIYEKLNLFDEAFEIIEILKNLDENVNDLEIHLKLKKINRSIFEKEEKFKKIANLKIEKKWIILRELFKIDSKKAWSFYEDKYFNNLIDIFYKRDITLPSNHIKESINLQKLFTIKGKVTYNIKKNSNNFYLDLIYNAYLSAFREAKLSFIYICSNCKRKYPIEINRCPNCHSAYKFIIEVEIAKK